MTDRRADDRALRRFNVIDDYIKKGLAVEANLSMPSCSVIQALNPIIECQQAAIVSTSSKHGNGLAMSAL